MLSMVTMLVGCPGPVEDTGKAPPLDNTTDTTECTGTAPVISELAVRDGTYTNPDIPDEVFQALVFTLTISDDDFDLHMVKLELGWETLASLDDADDSVTAEGTLGTALEPVADAEECNTAQLNYQFTVPLPQDGIRYDTPYEFALTAYDAHETPSAPDVIAHITPHEDGTPGDGPDDTGGDDTGGDDSGE